MSQIRFNSPTPKIIVPAKGTSIISTGEFVGKMPLVQPTKSEGIINPTRTSFCGLDVDTGCVLEVEPGGIVLDVGEE